MNVKTEADAAFPLTTIVSGGQTGVDRAALDVALALGIPHAGWCPRGRKAEDGRLPDRYQLRETAGSAYRIRTEKNVQDSDGTLILYRARLHGGTDLTVRLAKQYDRPMLLVRLDDAPDAREVCHWIRQHKIARMNVAGPRESSSPGIGSAAAAFLTAVLQPQASLTAP